MAAGNAEAFDGMSHIARSCTGDSYESSTVESATVKDALKALGLRDQQQILPGMEITLLPHQIIGVAWMYDHETSDKSVLPLFSVTRLLIRVIELSTTAEFWPTRWVSAKRCN